MMTLDDHIARFVAEGGRILVCSPMPASGDMLPAPEIRKRPAARTAPMSAEAIAAIPAATPKPAPKPKARPKAPPAAPKPRQKPGPKPKGPVPPYLARVAELAMAGRTRREIAAELNLKAQVISRYLYLARCAGLPVLRGNARKHELAAAVVAAYAKPGATIRGVAAELGMQRVSVRRMLRRAEVAIRPHGKKEKQDG